MKNLIKNLICGLVIFTVCPKGIIKAQDWSIVNIGTTNTLWNIHFTDLYTGWIIGNSGLIKKTTNGGATWFNQSGGTTESLRRIKMTDANTGFICGHNGIILKTTNGGTNWILTDLGTASYYSMDFGTIDYVVGDDKNYAESNDNGVNWYTGTLSGIADFPDIYGMDIISYQNIYVCTQASGVNMTPRVYKTTTSGISWFISKQFSPGSFSNTDLNDILFLNANTGFSAGTNGIMLKTSDAGLNWSETPLGSYDIRRIFFRDSKLGYACGSGGNISMTSNSGISWDLIPAGVTSAALQSGYSFFQPGFEFNVWCCGTNGVLIKSTNGGGIFKPPSNLQTTPVSNSQISLSWQDNSLVESKFVIYRSLNGFTYSYADSVDANVTSYINSGLNANTLYYYYVGAVSGSGNPLYSNSAYTLTLLNPPSLTSPANDTYDLNTAPNFSWTAVPGAASYKLQISDDSLFNTIVYNDSSSATNSYNMPYGILEYGNSYYWRVKGKTATNYSEYSPVWKFTTMTCDASSASWLNIESGSGNGNDMVSKVIADSKGNAFTAGRTWSSSTSDYDYATNKYNSSGNLLWSKTYNGTGNYDDYALAIATDTAGNVYVTGLSYNISNADYFTIKYNSAGDVLWTNRYNASGFWDVGTDISVDDSGNVYVTGQSYISTSSFDIVTIKYNSLGVQQWLQRYTGAGAFSDEGRDMCIDVSGNIIVTGLSYISGTYDFIILKYSSGGSSIWTKSYNGTGSSDDFSNTVCSDHLGNIYVSGQSIGAGSGLDYLTIKYNSAGTQLWTARYNGTGNSNDVSKAIASDISGNVYVSGYSTGAGSDYDYMTIKYNSSGTEQWTQRYNGTGNSSDEAYAMKTDNSGSVFVTGYSRTGGADSTEDIVTIKYGSDGSIIKKQNYSGSGNGADNAYSLDLDCAENIYVAGMISTSNQDFITIKYNSSDFVMQMNLTLNALIEGLYSGSTLIPDTIMVYLRSSTSPYNKIDSSKGILDDMGNCSIGFTSAQNGTPYFISVEHRNAIETWSSAPLSFNSKYMNYDFTDSASQAYGNNMVQISSSPVRFGFYSGDTNHDGSIDLSDITLVYNDAANFVTGYTSTDLTGDNAIDLSDLTMTYNNSNSFVIVMNP